MSISKSDYYSSEFVSRAFDKYSNATKVAEEKPIFSPVWVKKPSLAEGVFRLSLDLPGVLNNDIAVSYFSGDIIVEYKRFDVGENTFIRYSTTNHGLLDISSVKVSFVACVLQIEFSILAEKKFDILFSEGLHTPSDD